ncbi:MAG: CYTH domain-containing protein [Parcubacteria group bacterium]|nr:CYTH domain-containing protein [Parcubacteria group bacterium]
MYEIEIKSLLESKKRADELKRRLVQLFPALKTLPPHKQCNHYFNAPEDLQKVAFAMSPLYPSKEKREEIARILQSAKGGVSIRTRDADGKVFFIIKASIGDDSSANGVSRIEFEESVPLTLEQLDKKLRDAGLTYQAKWSREREHYDLGSIHITVDKNAGYGYLAEFEKLIEDGKEAGYAKQELKALMAELRCAELDQARLERMFKYYNEHWPEYYGTDKVFVVE